MAMNICEEKLLITEELWRDWGGHDFIEKCRNVETEGQSSVSRRKNQVKPLFVTSFKWTVAATECYS